MIDREIIRVKDVMSVEVNMVEGLATISEAMQSAASLTSKCFIVNMRDQDDEYGIVLLSDIAKQVLAKDKSPDRVNIYEIMSKPVISVDPDMDIRYCVRLFENFGIARAPVIRDKKVLGVIGYTDIVAQSMKASSLGQDVRLP